MSYIQIPQLKPLYPSHYHKDFRELLNFVAETYKESKAFILKHKNKGEVSYENILKRGYGRHLRNRCLAGNGPPHPHGL